MKRFCCAPRSSEFQIVPLVQARPWLFLSPHGLLNNSTANHHDSEKPSTECCGQYFIMINISIPYFPYYPTYVHGRDNEKVDCCNCRKANDHQQLIQHMPPSDGGLLDGGLLLINLLTDAMIVNFDLLYLPTPYALGISLS